MIINVNNNNYYSHYFFFSIFMLLIFYDEIFSYINIIRDIETKFLTVKDNQIDITPDFFIF